MGSELPGPPSLPCAEDWSIDGCASSDVVDLLEWVRCTVQHVFSRMREQEGSWTSLERLA